MRMPNRVAFLCILSLAFISCAMSQKPVDAQSFIIGAGDVLNITIITTGAPSTTSYAVQPDGYISVPLIGQVKASATTPAKLGALITERLIDAKMYVEPNVTVTVSQVNSRKAYISGDGIGKPGVIPLAAERASKFDVLSVKPHNENDVRQPGRKGPPPFAVSPKRLDARGLTLRSLIAHAYIVDESQVTGGPGWIDSERYDVAGAVDAPATHDQLLTMLRRALDERFAIQLHRETKTVSRYVLAASKNGPKFGPRFHPGQDSAPASSSPGTDPKTTLLKNFTMDHLCFFLTDNRNNWDVEAADDASLGPVLDQTGLSGVYDISVRWAPKRDWLSVFEGDLGLRVELRKIPSEILVVERAARPDAN